MDFYMRGSITEQRETEAESAIIKFAKTLPLLWLAGGVALAIYIGACNFRLWQLVTRERPLTDQKILDLLEDCKAQMGIHNILGIVVTDKVNSAALFGFIRPRLLLPAGMVETLTLKELRYVFMHELGHLRRRDIYVGWLMSLLQVLHWFNPLVWLAFYRMQSDRELACDALVLSYARGGESKEYGRTIVNLLERFSYPQRLPSMAGILENKSQLKRRIKMIAQFKKTSRTRRAGAMLLLTALAFIVLTNAYLAKADFEFGAPVNLGPSINTSSGETLDCFSSDGLEMYLDSNRSGGYGGWDLWVAKRETIDDAWSTPVNLGPLVNSGSHDWTAYISADGLELYYSSGRSGGYGSWDIWVTRRATKDDAWGMPENLGPLVNSSDWDGTPWISPDALELYFYSRNRTGGQGGIDIWISRRATKNDPWGEPMNLGPPVNSSAHETSPFLSSDSLLLFFGEEIINPFRPGGFGGTDMWVSRRASISDPWGEPVNLGPIVNSPSHDCGPRISPDGSMLYFASERPGGFGGMYGDIYRAPILPIVDFNGDGKVDMKDLRILAQYWGQNEPTCDIAPLPGGDGIVDEKDLNLFAEHLLKELQPVAHWKLDESGGSIAEDSIANNDGTLHGNPAWQHTEGMVNGAIELDGIDDYVSVPFILDPAAGSFSMFAWIKGGARGQMIISQKDTSDGRNTKLGCAWLFADPSYGRLMTRLMHPPFDPLVSESVITDGQWHHVGLVYDFDALHRYLYVDGKEVAKDTNPVGGVDSNGDLYFGASKTLDASSFFSGLIDDIRIYDEVLSAEEVADLAR
jgi:beta-lactamase regulating signal transducer with metallopeptidase domain